MVTGNPLSGFTALQPTGREAVFHQKLDVELWLTEPSQLEILGVLECSFLECS